MQFEEPGEDSMQDEDSRMEVNDDAGYRKDHKGLRKSGGFKNMDEAIKKGQKEKWQKKLAQIDQRRHDLLPEHAKMQKLSPFTCKIWKASWSSDGLPK